MVKYYVILNGRLIKVSEGFWNDWIHGPDAHLNLKETHLIKWNGPVWGRVVTYFTGCDVSGSDDPYLWETRLFDAAPFEIWRYTSQEQAEKRHNSYVDLAVWMLKKDGVELEKVEIAI